MSARLKEMYQNEMVDAMIKKFGYKNIMEVPKLDKIVVNMGVGEAKENAKLLDSAVKDMEIITGQKAIVTKAKKSVANFKIREGMPIGCKTTLRGDKMYEFADRLINLALPRVRDFRGVSANSFDGRGIHIQPLPVLPVRNKVSLLQCSVGSHHATVFLPECQSVKLVSVPLHRISFSPLLLQIF